MRITMMVGGKQFVVHGVSVVSPHTGHSNGGMGVRIEGIERKTIYYSANEVQFIVAESEPDPIPESQSVASSTPGPELC